jgi:hypothetical protein
MTWHYPADLSRKIPSPSMQCMAARPPRLWQVATMTPRVAASSCVHVRVRLRGYWGHQPVVESGSVPGRLKNLGLDAWRPALSHVSFSAAYSSGAVRRAPPCHRVVTEQPLSPTNKRLTIPVVRVPLLVDRAIQTTTRSTARRIRPWAVGRRFSNSSLLCAASARSSRKTPDAATPPVWPTNPDKVCRSRSHPLSFSP